MEEQYNNNIENAKNKILGEMDKKLIEYENFIQEKRKELQNEISGKNGTGYGKGDVAQIMENELLDTQKDYEELKGKRKKSEEEIKHAITTKDIDLLKNFNISVVQDSPIFREAAIHQFENQPAFQKTKKAIDAFLMGLGIILIMMKILQPKSLQMYFSGRLQEEWLFYSQGNYDKYLPESEQSVTMVAHQAFPEKFERMMIVFAANKDRRDKMQAEEERKAQAEKQKNLANQQKLEQSEQSHNERLAKEHQSYEYWHKNNQFNNQRLDNAKHDLENLIKDFLQNHKNEMHSLEQQKENKIKELQYAQRIYESKREDMNARIKIEESAQETLQKFEKMANELEKMIT